MKLYIIYYILNYLHYIPDYILFVNNINLCLRFSSSYILLKQTNNISETPLTQTFNSTSLNLRIHIRILIYVRNSISHTRFRVSTS